MYMMPPSTPLGQSILVLGCAFCAQRGVLGALLLKAKNRIRTPIHTFFVGRYFLRHQIVPRPIYKVAGTVPAHFDQGFSPKLQKVTFCPSKYVCIGPVC